VGVNITLKNIPDEIYASLKTSAQVHHRSLNSEVIACLERVLLPTKATNEAHLSTAREIRAELKGKKFKVADIDKAIDQGRP
jgi:antitoxin FitA